MKMIFLIVYLQMCYHFGINILLKIDIIKIFGSSNNFIEATVSNDN